MLQYDRKTELAAAAFDPGGGKRQRNGDIMDGKKRRQAFTAFMLLCLIAAAAIAGTAALVSRSSGNSQNSTQNAQDGQTEQLAAEEEQGNGKTGEENTDRNTGEETKGDHSGEYDEVNAQVQTGDEENSQEDGKDDSESLNDPGQTKEASAVTAAEILKDRIAQLSFSSQASVVWPVDGEICLEFNMEHTIYYPTLNIYRCNPGICISQEEGSQVLAGAKGIVTEIGEDTFYGKYVTVALGNGYEITYGQLGEITVNAGDDVTAETPIGTVGQPTIFYSTEGSHLFLKLEEDGAAQDPLDYLDYQ